MNDPWKSITLETRVIGGVGRRVLIAHDRLGFRSVRYGGAFVAPMAEAANFEEVENGLQPASADR